MPLSLCITQSDKLLYAAVGDNIKKNLCTDVSPHLNGEKVIWLSVFPQKSTSVILAGRQKLYHASKSQDDVSLDKN